MATIQGVYVALFGRPADPTGLNFFNTETNNGADLTAIGDLASTPEYVARFAGKSSAEIITAIYQSLFGRNPEQAGLDFFTAELAAGRLTPQNIAIAILDGAQGDDLTLATKKIAAADLFTAAIDTPDEIAAYQGTAAAAQGIDFVQAVTATSTAVDAAGADTAVAALAGGVTGGTQAFTTTVGEALLGTVGNDVFSGTADAAGLGATPAATLNTGDTVDGKGGTDTINIVSTSVGAAVNPGLTKDVEIVNLISDVPADTFAAGTANAANFSGVTQLWQKGGTASQAVTGVSNTVTAGFANTALNNVAMATGATTANIALENVATAGTTIVDEAVAGTLTTVNVNGSVVAAGTTTINLDAVGGGVAAATAETTVNVGLSSAQTVVITSATATTNDFSASTGAITSVGSAAATTVKGGSGNDVFTTGAATVTSLEGGAGNDTLDVTASTGAVTVNGGAGVDTMTGAGGAVVTTFEFNTGDTGVTAATADTIAANFTSAQDKLDFNLTAGSATNFLDGGVSSSFVDGQTNANTAFDGTVQYFFTDDAGGNGFLFVDSDLDGTADFAVNMTGVAAMVFGDVIA